MSLTIGNKGGLIRQLGEWLIAAAIIGAVLNAKDVQRYLTIRSM